MNPPKLIRITTVPLSLNVLLKGQLGFMSAHFEVLAVSSGPQEELDAVGRREGVDTRRVEMTRAITPLQDLKAVWQLYKLFKKENPSIVHTHTPKAGIVGMLAAKLAGVPHRLHTVAGLPLLEATGTKRKLLDFVEKLTYSCATKVYPNSKGLYDIIIKQGYIKPNVIVTPNAVGGKLKVLGNGSSNGIDTSHFNPDIFNDEKSLRARHCEGTEAKRSKTALRKELGISPRDFVFIFVGRLVGDKGINELVSAFSRHSKRDAKERHSEPQQSWGEGISSSIPKLLLVGPYEPQLDPLLPDTLTAIDQNPHIITTGYQADVRPYFAISDVLVFPSYREGFPNVVMQAGAMGLPAIVTDINGCNEIIQEGVNGTLVPRKPACRQAGAGTSPSKLLQENLETAMTRFLQDQTFYKQLQQNARTMICNRYEQQVVWEALLGEYLAVLRSQ